MGSGAALALQLLLGLLDRASQVGALINAAKSENRDITNAELDTLVAADDKAKQDLEDAIADARKQGG